MGEESRASTGPWQMELLENGLLDGGNHKQRKGYAELKPSHEVNDSEIQQESRQWALRMVRASRAAARSPS